MIELNKIFKITKNGKTTLWKAIEHPFLDGYALVKEHQFISLSTKNDEKYIVNSAHTLKRIEEQAYQHS